MTGPVLIGLLFLFPALALWTAWPRRRWAAWASGGGCLALWLAGFAGPGGELGALWAAAGLWSMAACFYSSYVVSRNAVEHQRDAARIAARAKRKSELAKGVQEAKDRIRGVESEQREAMALYGMVKGFSEALSWNDIRPKLETAVEQYLRVESFAFYVSGLKAQEELEPVVRRRLGNSPAGTWDTLRRLLQEKNHPLRVPQILQAPEPALGVPVFEADRLTGYFYARPPAGVDPAALLAKAQTFLEEISFAFRRIRLFQEMEQLSQVDGLTGVYRRGVLDDRLAEEVVRAQTFKTSFCLMILDIDHFKSLNDSYGHQFGDEVLQQIGEVLRGSVYDTDFVARYGGEEFAIVLPRAQPDGVLRKAETIRSAIEARPFQLAMERVHVTVSIGVAHFPRDAQSVEGIVRRADQALYEAKERGRNRVVDIIEVKHP